MRKRWNIKAKLAGGLAAIMAVSMVAPGPEVYAASVRAQVNYGDPVKLIFDPLDGPGLEKTNFSSIVSPENIGKRIEITGQAGYKLEDHDRLKLLPFPAGEEDNEFWYYTLDGHGLKAPVFNSDVYNTWNYIFQGFYDDEGRKVEKLDPRFQYNPPYTYTARWAVDPSKPYKYEVMYYRDLDPERAAKPSGDPSVWPDFADSGETIRRLREGTWKTGNHAVSAVTNTPMTISYDQKIAGYKLKDVLIKNNVSRNFYGNELPDPDHKKGIYVDSDNKVSGYMPNDNMTVAFRYEPDESVTYPVTIRYQDASGNPIKAPDMSRRYSVEQVEDLTPPSIDQYKITGVALTKGDDIDDLAGTGIFTATSAGSHIVGGAAGTGEGKANQFHLVMPNQPVEITFTYEPLEAPVTNVTVSYLYQTGDGVNHPIDGVPPETLESIPQGGSVTIPVKEIGGYQYSFIKPNQLLWELGADQKSVTIHFNGKSDTLPIVYVQNDDPNYWGTITFGFDGRYGNLSIPSDKTQIKFRRTEGISVGEAVNGITLTPNSHYRFDGWYKTNSDGNPTGSRLDPSEKLTETTKLFAKFVEDGSWYDITFGSGPNGTIGSSGVIHTNATLTPNWTYLAKPAVHPADGYTFDCWVDEAGNRIEADSTMAIESSQKYTATFRPLGVNPDGVPAKPNAAGRIAEDGKGRISVKGPGNNRKYVLTDLDGTIIESKNGAWLSTNRFFEAKLDPCADYQVYEVLQSVSDNLISQGSNLLDNVDPSKLSYPSLVTVPALGTNYKVENDGTGGKMKITVNPADPDSQYAVIDIDGNMVDLTDSAGGWVTPTGGTAALRGLEEKNLYTVIAKQSGETASPEEKAPMGSQISIPNSTQAQDEYTVELINGGYIEKVNGEDAGGASKLTVHKGDVVTINASDPSGRAFKKWNVIIGTGSLRDDLQSQDITIPNSNIVLQAEYVPQAGTPSNAVITFTTNNSSVGLDMSEGQQDALKAALTNNPSDEAAFAAGNQVTYTVKLDRRPPAATESDALKQGGYVEPSAKIPWTLTSGLARQVGSSNQPLPSDSGFNRNAPIRIYGNIDRSVQGYSDYHLWEFQPDGSLAEISMDPDPNQSADPDDPNFTGLFSFEGKIGSAYIMSYMEAYKVTIMDNKKPNNSKTISVLPDTAISDTQDYEDIDRGPITGTDGGLIWEYAGISKKENSSSQSDRFDPDTPITRNMTLYMLYDDSKWQAARAELNGELDRAKALIDDPAINTEDKPGLQNEIDLVAPAGNDHHTLSVDQLKDAYQYLHQKVEAVITGNQPAPPTPPEPAPPEPTPPEPTPPPPTPPEPDRPGGGGSGGGSSSGSSSSGGGDYAQKEHEKLPPNPAYSGIGPGYEFNQYKTYRSGTDGYWSQASADGIQWYFLLPDGGKVANQWINVAYNDLRGTCTYHFDAAGVMSYGWYIDEAGKSYFMNPVQGADYGRLTLGWYQDPVSRTWYYFDQSDGSMRTGWQKLGDSWYYLSPDNQAGHQKGTLYTSTTTPDGYQVDADGRWIEEAK